MKKLLLKFVALLLIPCLPATTTLAGWPAGASVAGLVTDVTPYHATTYHPVNDSSFEEQACLYGSQALAAPALEARTPVSDTFTNAAVTRTVAPAPKKTGKYNRVQKFLGLVWWMAATSMGIRLTDGLANVIGESMRNQGSARNSSALRLQEAA